MFQPILPEWVTVGKALIRDLFVRIKNNFDIHEERLNALEFANVGGYILNGDALIESIGTNNNDIFYFRSPANILISDFRVTLFSKNSIASGTLGFDLQKASTTNPASFSSILSSSFGFNFATAADYSTDQAIINSGIAALVEGDFIRIIVTSVPSGFDGKVHIFVGSQS